MSDCDLCPFSEGCHLCCASGPHLHVHQRPYASKQGAWTGEGTFEEKKIVFKKGGQCGIPVRDAISKRFEGLEKRDSRPFEGEDIAGQVTLRLEWPGYPSWSSTFRTRDHSQTKAPVTLSRLATDVCKSIEKFVNEMEGKECTEPSWKVGRDCYLNVDTLALVSVRRASFGSWVASIRTL